MRNETRKELFNKMSAKFFTGLDETASYDTYRLNLRPNKTYTKDFLKLLIYGLKSRRTNKWNRYDRPKSYRKRTRNEN